MLAMKLEHVTKTFGDVEAVSDVSLEVAAGELFGLLGPNGSGKTTLIKLLTGQLPPNGGAISVLDMDVLRNPITVREKVGIIPEQETPPSFLTAEEYLQFVCTIRKLDRVDDRCDRWFSLLDFADQKPVLCKDLSRGTRQKLMVAQAFLHEPLLAFIDEPLINLDPLIQRSFKDFLLDYIGKGRTIFFSTHVLEIAEEICTDIAILHRGHIVYKGPLSEVMKSHMHLEDFFIDRVHRGGP
ncbi:MAG: ABC transporter ATP-binding protein [Candidatus Thermoplasmatota archaeon]|nr:ABC transporter ATP-binding protein [Candidatus Thermoplasmatota archaeon]MBU1940612.1 ABC transporter ATP-binding protein [Candidatus Thermoplasmatota archaeon]